MAHGDFGILQHVLALGVQLRVVKRHTDRGGERNLLVAEGHRRRGDAAHHIGERGDLFGFRFRYDEGGELIAREARQRILRLQDAAKAPRKREQDRIAGRKSDGLVDLLEAVDVDADDGRTDLRVALGHRKSGAEPVEEQLAIRQAGQIVVHGVVQQTLLAGLDLGDVAERTDDAEHLTVGTNHGPRFHAVPEMLSVGGAQPEILVDAPAPLLQHGVETGAIAIALRGV